MANPKTSLLGTVLLALTACTGVQTGDAGDDSSSGCEIREEVLEDLDSIPEGFEKPPREMLAPLLGLTQGTLLLENGDHRVLELELHVVEGGEHMALFREETPGIKACEAQGVKLDMEFTVEGGEFISGSGMAAVRTLGEQIWVQLRTEEHEATLMPDFANETGGELQITATIQRDLDGKWHGTWNFMSSPVDCAGAAECSGTELAPLGTFKAD